MADSLSKSYLALIDLIATRIDIPKLAAIHLPAPVNDAAKADEFGFVFLEDGSAGPFYTSLADSLADLWLHFPASRLANTDTITLLNGFQSKELWQRALAVGAFNALSSHIMAQAAFSPVDVDTHQKQDVLPCASAGDRVGMVGYFAPLIDTLLSRKVELVVLEKNPQRVQRQPGLSLAASPRDLGDCRYVLCTASTLINDTLAEIQAHCQAAEYFCLLGPSSSGLPDVLFQLGVDAVAGISFHDLPGLQQSLANQTSWGAAGTKYHLSTDRYPGIDVLLKHFS